VGALANAELGTMFPRAGGDYVYLREAFHPAAGFLAGWLSFFAIYAGTVAALGIGFAAGLAPLLGLGEGAVVPLAVVTVALTSALNYVSVRAGAVANNVTGWLKVVALVGFGLLAPLSGKGDIANLTPLVAGARESLGPLAFALALSPVLFSYLGWNASVFVASEIRDPSRNVPRSLFVGLAGCVGIYLLLNAVYLYALPIPVLRETSNVGEVAASALFGGIGGRLLSGFVLASILGTLNATILVGPRIVYAMALDGLFFRTIGEVHARFRTPAGAVILQAVISIALILLLRSFPSALDFTTFAILLATIADVFALSWLRVRRPDLPRPYRAPGHPFLPGIYILANAAIATGLLIGRPLESLSGVAVLLLALPVYAFFARRP